jgi:dihydroneopterin aldolase
MERIEVQGIAVYAYHGCNPEERRDGQVFLLDLLLCYDSRAACRSDKLEDALNYAQVAKRAAALFVQPPCNLLERAAYRTARGLLAEFTKLEQITVRVHKPDAPVQTQLADVVYELVCTRGEGS